MKPPITDFWGKFNRTEGTWHPLPHHLVDVAACVEALLKQTILRKRLAKLGGLEDLNPCQIERLAVLSALHDVGKYNVGFQNKCLDQPPFLAGHVQEVVCLLGNDCPQKEKLIKALDLESLLTWGNDETVCYLLIASICHHGRPYSINDSGAVGRISSCWSESTNRNPFIGISELMKSLRRWFPNAFSTTDVSATLPYTSLFQHAFCGLVTLADWIASNPHPDFFPFSNSLDEDRLNFARERAKRITDEMFLNAQPVRQSLELPSVDNLSSKIFNFSPRDIQRQLFDLSIPSQGSLVILEAETGSGKTEAALAYFLRLFREGLVDGLYFALPTRTAALQIHQRVQKAVERAFPENLRPPVLLAVPGYIMVNDKSEKLLPNFDVLWPDDDSQRFSYRSWASEHPKRYMAGAIVVGTIDQALLSALMVNHAHLRATALLRHLLVVDEVHASDAYMNQILAAVLDFHLRSGGHALLMSATLGSRAKQKLLKQEPLKTPPESFESELKLPYPLITLQDFQSQNIYTIHVRSDLPVKKIYHQLESWAESPDQIAQCALKAAQNGARVLIIRNTVRDAIETQLALEMCAQRFSLTDLLFNCANVYAPHHARFAREDRIALDRALEANFGKNAKDLVGRVVVATQTAEQSLDIDADFLITDLCPMDVLLQRLGRLHRHQKKQRPPQYTSAQVVILVPQQSDSTCAAGDLSRYIGVRGNNRGRGYGPHGWGTVYEDLLILQATWNSLKARSYLALPEMNRELVEEATHPSRLELLGKTSAAWKCHYNTMKALSIVQGQTARLNLVNREVNFGDDQCAFPNKQDLEWRITTRLGEGDRLIEFPEPLSSPFGNSYRHLLIPAQLAIQANKFAMDELKLEIVTHSSDTLIFKLNDQLYQYDRLGLRRAEPATGSKQDSTAEGWDDE